MSSEPATRSSRWIVAFTSACGMVLVVWLGLPLATRGVVMDGNRWVREGLTRKLAAARTRRDTVLLAGGSNVLFGLSARWMEEQYGIPALNIAQHAGLGRRYTIDYTTEAAQPGDVVLLALEYALWEREKSRDVRNYYVLAHDTSYLYRQPPLQLIEFLAGVRLAEWKALLAARLRSTTDHAPGVPRGYQNATIDDWGDETVNTREHATRQMKERVLAETVRSRFVLDANAVREVRAFGDALSAKGARLVITFPGLVRHHFAWDINRDFYGELVAALRRANLQVVGSPEEAAFDTDCLFDSGYHPIRPCALQRTDRLIGHLRGAGILPAS